MCQFTGLRRRTSKALRLMRMALREATSQALELVRVLSVRSPPVWVQLFGPTVDGRIEYGFLGSTATLFNSCVAQVDNNCRETLCVSGRGEYTVC